MQQDSQKWSIWSIKGGQATIKNQTSEDLLNRPWISTTKTIR